MSRRIGSFVAAIALVSASMAAAQDGGSRLNRTNPTGRAGAVMPPAKEARVVMAQFGACVLNRRPAQAGRWMRLYPEGGSFQRTAYNLSVDDCLAEGQLSLNAQVLRASLWMAAYRRDFARAQPAYAAQDPAWAADVPSSLGPAEAASWAATRAYAACVVRAQPAAVHAMLTAFLGSPEEDSAFAAVTPALGQCLAAGATMRLNRLNISALLAEVAYRLAEARPA